VAVENQRNPVSSDASLKLISSLVKEKPYGKTTGACILQIKESERKLISTACHVLHQKASPGYQAISQADRWDNLSICLHRACTTIPSSSACSSSGITAHAPQFPVSFRLDRTASHVLREGIARRGGAKSISFVGGLRMTV